MTTFRSDAVGRRRTPRWLVVLACVAGAVLLVGVAVIFRARSFDADAHVPSLAVAGDIKVELPQGRRSLLRNLVQPGRPTLINLWATWCGPCRKEMPRLAEVRRRLGPDKLNMVFLNVRDPGSNAQDRAAFLAGFGLKGEMHAVLDERAIKPLTGASDVLVPRTLVYDAAGNAVGRITGYKPLAIGRVADMLQ